MEAKATGHTSDDLGRFVLTIEINLPRRKPLDYEIGEILGVQRSPLRLAVPILAHFPPLEHLQMLGFQHLTLIPVQGLPAPLVKPRPPRYHTLLAYKKQIDNFKQTN